MTPPNRTILSRKSGQRWEPTPDEMIPGVELSEHGADPLLLDAYSRRVGHSVPNTSSGWLVASDAVEFEGDDHLTHAGEDRPGNQSPAACCARDQNVRGAGGFF